MDFVTVATFSSYYDAVLLKSLLESEGISCFLKDEHSVTINPVLTNSVGGIKLQVSRKDYERAIDIMPAAGYKLIDNDEQSTFWQKFDSLTGNIPVIGNKNILFRFLILLIPIIFIIIITLLEINKEQQSRGFSTYNAITSPSWTVAFIKHDDKEIKPHTIRFNTNKDDKDVYAEKIIFSGETVLLPGINTNVVKGYWEMDKQQQTLAIISTDTLKEIYEGTYHIIRDYGQLILSSPRTTIYCTLPTMKIE